MIEPIVPRLLRRLTPLALLCFAAISVAAQPERLQRPIWKADVETHREQELVRSYETAGGTWMLVNSRPAGEYMSREVITELLGVNGNGEELARIDLDTLFAGKDVVRFHDLVVLADRRIAIFATNAGEELFAYIVDPNLNKIVSGNRLGSAPRALYISDVVPAEEGRFLVVGRSNDRGWMMKLDAQLAIRWDKTFDAEKMTIVHDAAVRPDGSIAAVGVQLLETGVTNLWVGEITSEGQVAERVQFAGREATIAVNGGRVAVVYDVKGQTGWDVFVRAYAPGLQEEWITPLAAGLRLPRIFRIAAAPADTWVVAGAKEKTLGLTAFGPGGATLWSWSAPVENDVFQMLWNVGDLQLRGSDVIVPYTLLTLDENERQVQRIRLIKLPLRAQ
jgi:hypothetical protein